MPPASSRPIADHTRPSMVSRYRRQASTAVNSASSVSISEALVPLVCCSPHASATGPTTAPNAAIASRRGRSLRCNRASRSMRVRDTAPTAAAPAYSSAAVVNAPRLAPKCWTSGVLTPNSAAASSASRPPLMAGREEINYFTVKRTVIALALEVTSAATTLAPLASLTPLASSLSPAAMRSASDLLAPLSTVSLPFSPVGAIGLPWSST
mmetsp:Transcript_34223/g.62238  ORF Transcript_34223/g.62238 Transcript_34223/m.62238 type:complete len:210 (+) Transcript_34223:1089-1718(+)